VHAHNELRTGQVPVKWKKYLILVDFGLISLEELTAEISRYPYSATGRLIHDLNRDIRRESKENRKNLYVIKLVSPDRQGQLPNFRVETQSELGGLQNFLGASKSGEFTEVWFCRTRVDRDIFSVAGRLVFTNDAACYTQLVEQVWRSSPRLLEQFSSALPCPYVRAVRHGWGWPYSIEKVHLPKNWEITSDELAREFSSSLRILEEAREKIETFVSFLDSFSFAAYSLEYKIIGSRLSVIDWDTPNDRKVINTRDVPLLS